MRYIHVDVGSVGNSGNDFDAVREVNIIPCQYLSSVVKLAFQSQEDGTFLGPYFAFTVIKELCGARLPSPNSMWNNQTQTENHK